MGLYQFCRMTFGLTGASSSFQRLMDTVLRGLPFILIHLDDILIHSRTLQLHMEHLRIVFEHLSAAGLTLRGRKCHIGLPRVSYLGHIFSGKGMEPDTQKLKAITSWPIPTELSGVRKFLDLASYYRRYIPRFSDIAEPLSALTRKGALFDWTQECTKLFNMLRTKLGAAPVLTYPKFSQNAAPFAVFTDASQIGLHQCHDPPTAGHQGVEKTLDRLRREADWVGIATDVRIFCRNCTTCQTSKLVSPAKAPLTNTPIGRPLQMLAADILEVPVSSSLPPSCIGLLHKVGRSHTTARPDSNSHHKGASQSFHHIWMPRYPQFRSRTKLLEHNPTEHAERAGYHEVSHNCIPSPRRWDGRTI